MLGRDQLGVCRDFHPDYVGPGFRGMADQDSEAGRRWKSREWFPLDIFGQDHSKICLIRLMIAGHRSHPFDASLLSGDQLRVQCWLLQGPAPRSAALVRIKSTDVANERLRAFPR